MKSWQRQALLAMDDAYRDQWAKSTAKDDAVEDNLSPDRFDAMFGGKEE